MANGKNGNGRKKPAKSRANAGSFRKGQSGNPRGRVKGVPNKATQEIKEIAARLLDETFFRNLKARIDQGKSEKVAILLCHYLYGIPKKTIQIEGGDSPVTFTIKIDDNRNSEGG